MARADYETGQSPGFTTLGLSATAPGAIEYIRAHELAGPIFNDMELGGTLSDRLHPARRPFIDSRNLDLQLLRRYLRILTSRAAWEEAQAEVRLPAPSCCRISRSRRGCRSAPSSWKIHAGAASISIRSR